MAITNMITERVKDVFAMSKNIVKVVKEEVIGFDNGSDYDYDYQETKSFTDVKSLFTYFDSFETKAKEVINTAFSGFSTSQSEEQAELEKRIAALEEKLSKLVEESLEALRKEDASI